MMTTVRNILLVYLLMLSMALCATEHPDTAIYQGMNLKLDLGNTIFELARTKAAVQSYEIAAYVNLQNKYFPTLELGYSGTKPLVTNGGTYEGQGGFMRVGCDLSALKKNNNPVNMLLVGVRIGTALQGFSQTGVTLHDTYWQKQLTKDFVNQFRCDAWGEIVGGVQVQVYKSFYMGWYVRLKILMTRNNYKKGTPTSYYIPGFGYKQDTNFGFNYYLGWNF